MGDACSAGVSVVSKRNGFGGATKVLSNHEQMAMAATGFTEENIRYST
jgi:NCAIR mutase (PurE)-related protein